MCLSAMMGPFPIKDKEHIVSYLNVMVVIIGAGIVGAATAYYLSNSNCGAGTSITILDAVGPAAGSSGRAGALQIIILPSTTATVTAATTTVRKTVRIYKSDG